MNDNKIEGLEAKLEELNARISFNWYIITMSVLQLPTKAIDTLIEELEGFQEAIENSPSNNLPLNAALADATPVFKARFADEISNLLDHLRDARSLHK